MKCREVDALWSSFAMQVGDEPIQCHFDLQVVLVMSAGDPLADAAHEVPPKVLPPVRQEAPRGAEPRKYIRGSAVT